MMRVTHCRGSLTHRTQQNCPENRRIWCRIWCGFLENSWCSKCIAFLSCMLHVYCKIDAPSKLVNIVALCVTTWSGEFGTRRSSNYFHILTNLQIIKYLLRHATCKSHTTAHNTPDTILRCSVRLTSGWFLHIWFFKLVFVEFRFPQTKHLKGFNCMHKLQFSSMRQDRKIAPFRGLWLHDSSDIVFIRTSLNTSSIERPWSGQFELAWEYISAIPKVASWYITYFVVYNQNVPFIPAFVGNGLLQWS